MKIYIKSSLDYSNMFVGTPFKCDTITSYYNNFLNEKDLAYMQKAKNRTGEIVMMSPNEYFKESAEKIFHNRQSIDQLKRSREIDSKSNAEYKEAMKNGAKFPLCYLNYADNTQEGLHRMMVAGDLYGWDTKFPVLIVTVADQEWEDHINTVRAAHDFLNYDFEKVCKEAAYNLSDWKSAPPDNFVDLLKEEVIKEAKQYEDGYDIDVDIEIEEIDDHPQVRIYLTRYDDYEFEVASQPVKIWLDDLFDLEGESASNDIDIDDLEDLDIADLFIK